ncbi:MAG: 1-deoxy-D-xylulose-5-phosphate reductoisomerase [Candidatus Korarchaeota archaeon]|nr:1-deoxy-D-xylulose-5-phosphate reductoisomerase [Candidatus Korarchaeota archaeon]
MKKISILGSTGSIGRQTLDVISQHPEKFSVVGLSAGNNIELLLEQITTYGPTVVSVADEDSAKELGSLLGATDIQILYGDEGAQNVARMDEVDLLVSAMVGASGLKPTIAAARSGKDIALANKESLVIAGEVLTSEVKKNGGTLLPIDSEHSAIFQALGCGERKDVKRLILTASGGPFLKTPKDELEDVSVEVALNHPTWKMGKKITIDSATLMNKGFEVIEAKWLFGFDPQEISVWIHPQSIVHSMVEYIDGSVISQMGKPDMRIPIAFAISYPDRLSMNYNDVSPESFGELSFEEVDFEQFPCLSLAFDALREGGTMPSVMNGANEVAVSAFLSEDIKFTGIVKTVAKVMELHKTQPANSLETVLESDTWARNTAQSLISN